MKGEPCSSVSRDLYTLGLLGATVVEQSCAVKAPVVS